MYKKVVAGAVIIGTMVSVGCGKTDTTQTDSEVPSTQAEPADNSPKNQAQIKPQAVQGYKDFMFGMAAADVAKLPECFDNYKSSLDPGTTAKLQRELELDKKNTAESIASYERTIRHYESVEAEGGRHRNGPKMALEDYNQAKEKLAELSARTYSPALEEIAKREAEIQQEQAKIDAFDPEMLAEWAAVATCTVVFGGQPTKLKPYFESNKLVGLELDLGEFNNEKYHSLVDALTEKYGLTHAATDDQISAFNKEQSAQVVTTFANNQIGLTASNQLGFVYLSGLSIDEGIPTTNRHMKLSYVDLANAAKLKALATKGQTTADDL